MFIVGLLGIGSSISQIILSGLSGVTLAKLLALS